MPRTEKVNQQIRDERRAQILSAATKVFARNGFVGTRIDDIASAAGMSKGLLYHYFGSKESVFNTLISDAEQGTIRLFQQALEMPGGATDRLRRLIEQAIAGLAEKPQIFMVVLQAFVSDAVPQEASDLVSSFASESGPILTRLITDGQKEGTIIQGDPQELATLLGACLQGLAITAATSELKSELPTPDSLVALFIR